MQMIIAMAQHKGGVGKTTSVVNLGAALALKGKKVLLIDFDPQANLTSCLGIEDPEEEISGACNKEYPLPIEEIKDNLSLVPASLELCHVELELVSKIGRENVLKKLIHNIRDKFDYIFIDCPPSLGLLTVNAFVAADAVLAPFLAEKLPLKGLARLTQVMDEVKELNSKIYLLGLFACRFDERKNLNKGMLTTVKKAFPDKLLKTFIRENIKVAESQYQGVDVFEYDSKCHGSEDYTSLAKEIIKLTKK